MGEDQPTLHHKWVTASEWQKKKAVTLLQKSCKEFLCTNLMHRDRQHGKQAIGVFVECTKYA
jgi:hypothetical protein